MFTDLNSFLKVVSDWFEILFLGLRAGVAPAIEPTDSAGETDREGDPSAEKWRDSDPMATGSSVNRYVSDSPGYLTSNGLGSLEIGAAED
jgi:hypothetical protein